MVAPGPLGPRPVQAVVAGGFEFLEELRRTGASWEQVAVLLRSEGLMSRRGRPVSASVLRAMFSRTSRDRPTETGGAGKPEKPTSSAVDVGKREQPRNNWYQAEAGRDILAERLARASQLRGSMNEGE